MRLLMNPWIKLSLLICFLTGSIVFVVRSIGKPVSHDFTNQCALCHEDIPAKGTPFKDVKLKDNPDRLCISCHQLESNSSHPVNVHPHKPIPLQAYLDEKGNVTCLTCHDVHKEDNSAYSDSQLKGLLRGHVSGRAFCFVCHNKDFIEPRWQHTNSINYAHMTDNLIQNSKGVLLDPFSVECLSCHDGVVSKMNDTSEVLLQPRSGEFNHSIGLSHPIGVEYPDTPRKDFVNINALPPAIKLFEGKMGCLTCHNPYGTKTNSLVINNRGSALCLACHRK